MFAAYEYEICFDNRHQRKIASISPLLISLILKINPFTGSYCFIQALSKSKLEHAQAVTFMLVNNVFSLYDVL